jgi:hypothetical protein
MLPGIEVMQVKVVAMRNEKGEELSRANPGNIVFLTTEPLLSCGVKNGILRRDEGVGRQGCKEICPV